MHHSKK